MQKALIISICCILFYSCKKSDGPTQPTPQIATVTTTSTSTVTTTSVSVSGNVSADGGATVTSRGFCWGITPGVVISGSNYVNSGTGTGTYSASINGLNPGTVYFVRAFATNSVGTAYGNELSFTTTTPNNNVYVAGTLFNGSNEIATVWKNGVVTQLSNGTRQGYARAVFVSGSDVYVAGFERNVANTLSIATIWKNGVGTALTTAPNIASDAFAVYVDGTDVYVAGYEETGAGQVAKIWKNGVATSLTTAQPSSMATGVAVSGTDVYACGYNTNGKATYWKNGTPTYLNFGTAVSGIFVNGADISIAGITGGSSWLWHNTVTTNFPGSNAFSSICGLGADTYIAGTLNNLPTVWKNGISTTLPSVGGGETFSVFAILTDVFVAGDQFNGGNSVARYWKNGVATDLPKLPTATGYSIAYSIYVTP